MGGLSLLEPTGARAASLGEAFSAMTNDITAFGYNPASLGSLETGQASFMYEKGLAEDSYGHFLIGTPSQKGSGLGLYLSQKLATLLGSRIEFRSELRRGSTFTLVLTEQERG